MKRFFKYISYLFLGLILLIILFLGFTRTQIFRDWLRDYVVKESKSFLNGELQIKQIRGNLMNHLEISGILLTSGQDTIIYLPRFKMDFKPLRLLEGEIKIDSVFIDTPYVRLYQLRDSSWNMTHLLKSDTTAQPDTSAASEPFGMEISLGDFHLREGRLDISAFNLIFPKQVRRLNTRFSGGYSTDKQEIHLQEFRFVTSQPDFSLQELSFRAARDDAGISVQNFVLRTGRNQLNAEGEYAASPDQLSHAALVSKPLHLGEFHFVLPDFTLHSQPTLSLNTRFQNDSLRAAINIADGNQRIFLQSDFANVSALLNDSVPGQLRYSLNGKIEKLDLAYWLGDPQLDFLIDGDFQVEGRETTAEDATVQVTANFPGSKFSRYSASDLNLAASYIKGDAAGTALIRGDFGKLFLNAEAADILNRQRFRLDADIEDLNVAKLIPNDSLQTDINLKVQAGGSGFDPEKIDGSLQLTLSPSQILDISIDTLLAAVNISKQQFTIDSLHFGSNFAEVYLNGVVKPESESNLFFHGQVKDLMALKSFINADTVHADGFFNGRAQGKLDSLFAQINVQLENIVYNEFLVDSLTATVSVLQDSSGLEGNGTANIRKAKTVDLAIEGVSAQTSFTGNRADILLDITASDSLSAHLESQLVADSILRVIIPNINLRILDREWIGGSPDMQVILDGSDIHLQNIKIERNIPEDEKYLFANGIFSLEGEENLQLKISGLELTPFAELFRVPLGVNGQFYTDINLTGTAEKPLINGSMDIRNGQVDEFAYNLNGRFNYTDERFTWDYALIPNGKDSLTIEGYLPLNLSLKNQGELIYENRPIKLNVKSSGIPLSAVQIGTQYLDEVRGQIICDLNVTNTLKEPRAQGIFNIVDGAFKITKYGIDYSDFQLRTSLDSTRISIDTLRASRNDGYMMASGYFDFDSTLMSGVLKSTQIQLLANKFFIAQNQDYEVQISADVNLSGNTRASRFGGFVNIIRSSFYLPALMEESTSAAAKTDVPKPMLVEALESTKDTINVNGNDSSRRKKEKDTAPDIYKNLSGSLKLTMPRNTWIKSPRMRLEIEGDLDLVKSGPEFEIFGTIAVLRGHYEIVGKRFNISEGKLTFLGGEEINPDLLIKAEHKFRNAAREQKTILLSITGKAMKPELKFSLDGTEISEGDAVSYVMFGRSLDELTYGQQSAVADETQKGSAGNLALGVAANYLSSEITKSVGKDLNLDYIEIKGQENWSSATFSVGKYVTNDLFASYERGFGETSSDDVSKEVITLEYQIKRLIFLQLIQGTSRTSGVDVFLKLVY
jgi:translocation and assembly module TamB